ncbi:putative aminoglycoside N3'-acetyltransferase-like protein [Magnetofaba australis IT-1]|uniref:Aminoglycoside N(3)-acetyltransferase n=1 Tax=Magnetofaba australis IT-1 TaxID=1434232 RepID=A0A1Y2K7B0_9PROT|nr:putative aminoglycoside N3'-acetyltransferase-like protein [Magnetofaba australis IT-1]
MHSAMDRIQEAVPQITPTALISMMQELLGPDGTLLMPTFPFRGLQRDYAATLEAFDRRRTPCRVGLLPEVFRRLPGVMRSLHPTHPVAGWGARASALLEDHHKGLTFGAETSPFYRLTQCDGVTVGLGVREPFTLYYVPEELDPDVRAQVLEPEPRLITLKEKGAVIGEYPLRAFRVARDWPNLMRMQQMLHQRGVARYSQCGPLLAVRADARAYVAGCATLLRHGLKSFQAPT